MSERPSGLGELVLEDRFAIVPEWLLDAPISDCAVRLYAVLLRFGQSSGCRMPARSTLARRIHKQSTDTVDRALKDLVACGALVIEPRYAGRERLTNRYIVRTGRPAQTVPSPGTSQADAHPASTSPEVGIQFSQTGRRIAATPKTAAGPTRSRRVTLAADLRPNPEFLTENTPPPPPSSGSPSVTLEEECGILNWSAFVSDCQARRNGARRSSTRWSGPCLAAALELAVRGRGWPVRLAAQALLLVAADPETRSPMRLAEAGPWWDHAAVPALSDAAVAEVQLAEAELGEVGGLRVLLQKRARSLLADEGLTVTRATVAIRARALLHELGDGPVAI